MNLLKGEPTVIMLDELPPYFEYARSKPIGNSDLAVVTGTALANLLVAVTEELPQCCVIITDLKASYEGGTQQLSTEGHSASTLMEAAKKLKATHQIVHELREEHTPDSDPQMVQALLKAKHKFLDQGEAAADTFRQMLEQRLFTQRVMPWSEVRKRAAMETR